MKIIGTHQSKISSIWRLPMDYSPSRTNLIKPGIYGISYSGRVVKLNAYCLCPSLNAAHIAGVFQAVYYVFQGHWIFSASYGHKNEVLLSLYQMIRIWGGVSRFELLYLVKLII